MTTRTLALAACLVALAAPAAAQISVGQTIEGRLETTDARMSDGSYLDCHDFRPPSGRTVQIDQTSDAFDSYMQVTVGPCANRGAVLASDDDGGGGLNSRVTRAFTEPAVAIIVNSLTADQTGPYRLSVRYSGETAGKPGAGAAPPAANPPGINSPGFVASVRANRPTSLPRLGPDERWGEANPHFCTAVYEAVMELRSSGSGGFGFGNVDTINYTPRAAVAAARVTGLGEAQMGVFRNNFASMILVGSLGTAPNGQPNGGRPLAQALTLLGDCDRMFGQTPVTTY